MLTQRQKSPPGDEELEEEEGDGSVINPMLNDVVLTRMFELCPLKDLLRFCLVSKQWSSLALPILRREMPVTINLWKCNDPVKEDCYVERIKMLPIGDRPFETYNFNSFKFQHYDIQPETQLFDKLGPWIRKLTLTHGVVCCVRALQQFIFDQSPNLEELHINQFNFLNITECGDLCQMPKYPRGSLHQEDLKLSLKSLIITSTWGMGRTPFPLSWKMMFARFPNLERIHFNGFNSKSDFLPFVEALEEVDSMGTRKKSCRTKTIKDFKFDARFDNDDCTSAAERLLRLPQMRLEALHITCRNTKTETDRTNLLQIALQIHGRHLKKLEIQNGRMINTLSQNEVYFEPFYPDFPFQVGSFDSMTELTLEGVIASNLHFLNEFPNLKVLRIRQNLKDRILNGTDFSRIINLVLPGVRKLEFRVFNTTEFHLSEENMEMLVRMMPNVDDFEGNWRRMGKLNIYAVDAASGEQQAGGGNNGWVIKWETRSFPNVGTLNDLKGLTRCVDDDPATTWTGFEELPLLHTINFNVNIKNES